MGRQLAQAIMVEGTDLVQTAIDPLSHSHILLRVPLRRAAGERVGPIAKQWEGEVVLRKGGMLPLADAVAHLTLPALRAGPLPLPLDDAGGEGLGRDV